MFLDKGATGGGGLGYKCHVLGHRYSSLHLTHKNYILAESLDTYGKDYVILFSL